MSHADLATLPGDNEGLRSLHEPEPSGGVVPYRATHRCGRGRWRSLSSPAVGRAGAGSRCRWTMHRRRDTLMDGTTRRRTGALVASAALLASLTLVAAATATSADPIYASFWVGPPASTRSRMRAGHSQRDFSRWNPGTSSVEDRARTSSRS